jgi:hypothetical protein
MVESQKRKEQETNATCCSAVCVREQQIIEQEKKRKKTTKQINFIETLMQTNAVYTHTRDRLCASRVVFDSIPRQTTYYWQFFDREPSVSS